MALNIQTAYNGGKDRLGPNVTLQARVFRTDPMIRAVLRTFPRDKVEAQIAPLIKSCITAATLNKARFDEIHTAPGPITAESVPACSAVWLPPGEKFDGLWTLLRSGFLKLALRLGYRGVSNMTENGVRSDEIKKTKLRWPDGSKVERYWYLFFLGTEAEARGKGLGAKVLGDFQKDCDVPIYLESSSEGSRRLYMRCGFEELGTWVVGKGQIGKDGLWEEGGEGVRAWAMVWWPKNGKA